MVTARKLLADILADFSEKAPRAMECLENSFDDVTPVMVGAPAGKGNPHFPEHRLGHEATGGSADGAG